MRPEWFHSVYRFCPRLSSLSAVLVLSLVAVSVHLLPLSFSQFPFNNDGLTESVTAQNIIDDHHFHFPKLLSLDTTHSEGTPVFNVVLAFLSSALGVPVIRVSQFMVAMFASLTIVGIYLIVHTMTGDRRAALVSGLVAAFYGTFVFLTASVWKESLGIALFVLLLYAYSKRERTEMLALEAAILLVVPFVHHLAAFVCYMTVGYLTLWSWIFAVRRGQLRTRHYYDLAVAVVPPAIALTYYYLVSFGRLSYFDPETGLLPMVVIVLAISIVSSLVLFRRSHWRGTFSPIPAVAVLALVVWDYYNPIFQYEPAVGEGYYFTLIVATAALVSIAWYGLERVIESSSPFRAIPIGALLPAITILGFAFLSPSVENKHQLVYRSFDFADPAIFICIGFATSLLAHERKRRRFVALAAVAVVLALITLPFGLYTEELTGVRHDTQDYEVDAVRWVVEGVEGRSPYVMSDERISYICASMFGVGKDTRLPSYLSDNMDLAPDVYYFYEESWSEEGVNDYPRGTVVISDTYMAALLSAENVLYVGGDVEDQAIIFMATGIGQAASNW
jgi:hypothetical protein